MLESTREMENNNNNNKKTKKSHNNASSEHDILGKFSDSLKNVFREIF
jgi:hypothetical protein